MNIRNLEQYQKFKFADHTNWKLPRNIRPTDCDMLLDNAGKMLWVEFKSIRQGWYDLTTGQQGTLGSFLRLDPIRTTVAICWHQDKENFSSRDDIIEWQLIRSTSDGEIKPVIIQERLWLPGKYWATWVENVFYK